MSKCFVAQSAVRVFALVGLVAAGSESAHALPPIAPECPAAATPYVFVVMDTSGSMNRTSSCTASELAVGLCGQLCPTGNCRTDFQADDPNSKLYFAKAGLAQAIELGPNVRLGFASFNQDALKVRGKHWIYSAANDGPSIPGFGPFPAVGNREVLGLNWTCDNGSGDAEVGCYGTTPADTNDAWEVERVRHLPKGGATFTTTIPVYLRVPGVGGATYRVTYTPLSGPLGASTVTMRVTTARCLVASCSSSTQIGLQNVTFNKLLGYLSWDNGSASAQTRSNPDQTFFTQGAASDTSASNSCSGWDPNTDSAVDATLGYNLRFPTVSDPRGTLHDRGDVIPLDWIDDNRDAVRTRLSPSLALGGEPEYGIANYLNDAPVFGQSYLRLKNEAARPLIASGSTPIGTSLRAFRTWYEGTSPFSGWAYEAEANDPDFLCRRKAVILLTDGADTCGNVSPCAEAAQLANFLGVGVYVIGLEASAATSLACVAYQGGTTAPWIATNVSTLTATLDVIFSELNSPPPAP